MMRTKLQQRFATGKSIKNSNFCEKNTISNFLDTFGTFLRFCEGYLWYKTWKTVNFHHFFGHSGEFWDTKNLQFFLIIVASVIQSPRRVSPFTGGFENFHISQINPNKIPNHLKPRLPVSVSKSCSIVPIIFHPLHKNRNIAEKNLKLFF